jgi:hypothetical protein
MAAAPANETVLLRIGDLKVDGSFFILAPPPFSSIHSMETWNIKIIGRKKI